MKVQCQLIFAALFFLFSKQQAFTQEHRPFMDKLFAWCIVPFDNQERTPEQRIEMLKELGFRQYAYDWRSRHLPEMAREFRLASENGITVMAVWLWIEAGEDKPGKLSSTNEQVLQALKDAGLSTQIWVGFHANYFEGLAQEEAIARGIEMVRYLSERVVESGSKIALYNHGDWLGEPENQLQIIKALPELEIGIIYNFHHGHEHISRFEQLVPKMMPYIWAVNLNGMRRDGPKILPLGSGDEESWMLGIMQKAGYKGPYGILGHVEDADVRKVLIENLDGFQKIFKPK